MTSHVFNEEILEGVACGVVIAAPSGEVLKANSVASQLLGLPRDDLVRQNLLDLLGSPDSSLPLEDLLKRVVEDGKTISELALSPADEAISLSATISPLQNAAGQTDKIVLTIFGRSRQERRAPPAIFCAEVMAHAPIGIALVDAREFRLRWANDTYRQFLEEPFRNNPDGVPFRELVPQSEERGVMDIFRRVAATGVPFVHSEFEHIGFARGVTYWRWALFPLVENDSTPDLMIVATEITEQVTMRQRVEAKRARLRKVLATLPVGVMIIEPDGRIIEANEMVSRIWRGPAPLSENIGSWREYRGWQAETGTPMNAEDWPASQALHGKTILGKVVDIERFDGTRGTILISAAPIPATHGGTGAVVVFQDITEQRLAENALREKERLLRVIFDEAFQLTGLLTPDGRVLQINRTAADLLEVDAESVIGQPFPDTPWWAHSAKEREKLREGLQAAARGRFVRFETSHRRPDGRMMEIDFSLKPVLNEENRVVLIVPEGRDITDRKVFERSLQESQKTFSRLFQLNPDWISLSRLEDGMFIDVNEGFSRLTGYRNEEVVGRSSVGELRIWADPQDRARLIGGLRRENDIVNLEARFKNKEGRFFIGWISGRRLEIQGEICLLAMVRDITDRKELEEELHRAKNAAEAANKAKSEFLATVSHELRTPLTVTMGMTDLALDLFPDKEICSFLQMAKHSSDSLLILINDILDMAEMESGRLELVHSPFSVRDCLGGVIDRFSASAAEKELDLCLEVSAEVPDYIASDPKRVRQVLTNLVGNAVKFTHRGSVSVRVDRLEDGGQPAILFQVRDTGIGVPIEKRDRLFKAFSQVDSSSTRQFGGAGIGLAISKGLVERLGGRLWMEGEDGKGSTFFFTIPEHQPTGKPLIARGKHRSQV